MNETNKRNYVMYFGRKLYEGTEEYDLYMNGNL